MKKYILCGLALFCINLNAQDISMLEGNPEWSYVKYETADDGNITTTYTHIYLGDKESRLDNDYYKVYVDEKKIMNNTDVMDTKNHEFTDVLLREQDKKIYAHYDNLQGFMHYWLINGYKVDYMPYSFMPDRQEFVLYDFALESGYVQEPYIFAQPDNSFDDIMPDLEDYFLWELNATGNITLLNNETRLVQDIIPYEFEDIEIDWRRAPEKQTNTWIEGIGSTNSLIYDPYISKDEYSTCVLNFFKQYGEIVYANSQYIDDLFLGEEFLASVNSVSKSSATAIYDLQGRRLLAAPEKGIYIENGRKVIK